VHSCRSAPNNHLVVTTARVRVSLQFGAQAPRFHAHDRVHTGIEVSRPVKDFDADDVLFHLFASALQSTFHGELQKAAHARGMCKNRASEELAQMLADNRGIGMICHVLLGVFYFSARCRA
jgi:hypothetical protein